MVEPSQKTAYSNYIVQNRLSVNNFFSEEMFGVFPYDDNVPQMYVRNVVTPVTGRYSVPDDGADHEVMVEDLNLKADYTYHVVPKLSKDVYLVASVPTGRTSTYKTEP